ncbi:MAG: hypothetical protein NTW08_02880 [Gammaproteobacteria bacterium]|nr:hypothetical protein [Gammaproteobacteria bacterium]
MWFQKGLIIPSLSRESKAKLAAVLTKRAEVGDQYAQLTRDPSVCHDSEVVRALGELKCMLDQIDSFMQGIDDPQNQGNLETNIMHFHDDFPGFYTLYLHQIDARKTVLQAFKTKHEEGFFQALHTEEYKASTRLVDLLNEELYRLINKNGGGKKEEEAFRRDPQHYITAHPKLDARIKFLYHAVQQMIETNTFHEQALRRDLETPPHTVKPATLKSYHQAIERELVKVRTLAYELASSHFSHRNTKIIEVVTDSIWQSFESCQNSPHPFNFHCEADDVGAEKRVFTTLGKKMVSMIPEVLIGKQHDTASVGDDWDDTDAPVRPLEGLSNSTATPPSRSEQVTPSATVVAPKEVRMHRPSHDNKTYGYYFYLLENSVDALKKQLVDTQARLGLETDPERELYTDRAELMIAVLRQNIKNRAPDNYHFDVDEEIKAMAQEVFEYINEHIQELDAEVEDMKDTALAEEFILTQAKDIFGESSDLDDDSEEIQAEGELEVTELKKHNPFVRILRQSLEKLTSLHQGLKALQEEKEQAFNGLPMEGVVKWCDAWRERVIQQMDDTHAMLWRAEAQRDNAFAFDEYVKTDEYGATAVFIHHLEREVHRLLKTKGAEELRVPLLCKALEQFRNITEKYEHDIEEAMLNIDADETTFDKVYESYHDAIQSAILEARQQAFTQGLEHVTHQHTKLFGWLGRAMQQAYQSCDAKPFTWGDHVEADRATQIVRGLANKTAHVVEGAAHHALDAAKGVVGAAHHVVTATSRQVAGAVDQVTSHANRFFKDEEPPKTRKRAGAMIETDRKPHTPK